MPGLSPLARGTPLKNIRRLCDARFIPAGAGNTKQSQALSMQHAVYPRWRGEHYCVEHGEVSLFGLSPLARGTPSDLRRRVRGLRFIPAGAGNTFQRFGMARTNPVYPRWRGEHHSRSLLNHFYSGLSPLARGTRPRALTQMRPVRFIPAGAGNTGPLYAIGTKNTVYPRWRGEHSVYHSGQIVVNGLSPLARGTQKGKAHGQRRRRFIPAGAGNTRRVPEEREPPAVYPRWRGEHIWKLSNSPIGDGLSPLARGTRKHKRYRRSRSSVYPRWRGEHTLGMLPSYVRDGLSPLARGTLSYIVLQADDLRFIPAGAGNTVRR